MEERRGIKLEATKSTGLTETKGEAGLTWRWWTRRIGRGLVNKLHPYPHPRVFFAKSAESLENKRVEFLVSAKKRKRVRKNVKRKDLSIVASDEWRMMSSWMRGTAPPPPVFFVTAHSKGVAGENLISAHSKRLKVVVFSMSWEWLVSADSKEFIRTLSILLSILLGTAHSKGVRRTACRGRMARRARRDSANSMKPLWHAGTVCQG